MNETNGETETAEELAEQCFTVHPPPCKTCGDFWNAHEVDLEGPAPCEACDCEAYNGPTVREHYQGMVAEAIQDQMDKHAFTTTAFVVASEQRDAALDKLEAVNKQVAGLLVDRGVLEPPEGR